VTAPEKHESVVLNFESIKMTEEHCHAIFYFGAMPLEARSCLDQNAWMSNLLVQYYVRLIACDARIFMSFGTFSWSNSKRSAEYM